MVNEKALDLVVKMVESNKEDTDRRFDNIERKLDEILKFKWQIIGGSAAVATFITIMIQVGSFFLKVR